MSWTSRTTLWRPTIICWTTCTAPLAPTITRWATGTVTYTRPPIIITATLQRRIINTRRHWHTPLIRQRFRLVTRRIIIRIRQRRLALRSKRYFKTRVSAPETSSWWSSKRLRYVSREINPINRIIILSYVTIVGFFFFFKKIVYLFLFVSDGSTMGSLFSFINIIIFQRMEIERD